MKEITITVQLQDDADTQEFETAATMALRIHPKVVRLAFEDEEEQDWDEDELEHLIHLPGSENVKITETRFIHVIIDDLIDERIPKQQIVVWEFLSQRLWAGKGVIKSSKEFHALLTKFTSQIWPGEQVFKHCNQGHARTIYSRLRRRLPKLDLCGRNGWYGFNTAVMPHGKNISRVRKKDPLLNPNVSIEDALKDSEESNG